MSKLGIYKHIVTVLPNSEGSAICDHPTMIKHIKQVIKLFGVGNVIIRMIQPDGHYRYTFNEDYPVLSFAVYINDLKFLKWILDFDKENISSYVDGTSQVGPYGDKNPLELAVRRNNIEAMQLLLQYSSGKCFHAFLDALRWEERNDIQLLMEAVRGYDEGGVNYNDLFPVKLPKFKKKDIIKLFIEAGVDVNQYYKMFFLGNIVPLGEMIYKQDFVIAKMLIDAGADVTLLLPNRVKLSEEMVSDGTFLGLPAKELQCGWKLLPDFMTSVEYLDDVYHNLNTSKEKSKFTPQEYKKLRALLISKGAKEKYCG